MKFYNNIKSIFFVVFLLAAFTVMAQNASISGKITDSKNLSLTSVAVYIKGTSTGTTSNGEGRYHILLRPGHYDLVFALIGFKTFVKSIDLGAGETILDLVLPENTYNLNEVTVRAEREDPARRIMRNVIARRDFYTNQVHAYSCQVYIKGIQKLRNAPKSFLGTDVQGELKNMGLDSGKRGILYLSESVSRLKVKKPGSIHEEMISSKVSGNNSSFSFNQASDLMVNFYQNRIDLTNITPRQFISPLADNGFSMYRYKLIGKTENLGHQTFRIQVIPRRKGANLFQGLLYIQDSSWNIQSLDLRIADQSKIDLLDTLQIRQQFIEPATGVFVLSTVEFRFSYSIFKFKGYGSYLESLSNYTLNPKFTVKDFPPDILQVVKNANAKDSTYWNSIRAVPLTHEEIADYKKKDSIFTVHNTRRYQDSIDHKRNRLTPSSLLLGQTFTNKFKKRSFNIAPFFTVVSYNTVEGLAFSPDLSFTQNTTDTSSYTIGADLRYGFINRRFNPSARFSREFSSLRHTFLSIEGGFAVKDQNRLGGVDPFYNTVQTVFEKRNPLKLYERHFIKVDYSTDLTRQINFVGGLEFARRIPLANTAYAYLTGSKFKIFSANNPFSPPGNQLAFQANQAFNIHLGARINFGEKFVVRPDMIIPQGSDYPTLFIDDRAGIPGVLGSSPNYNLLSFRVAQNNIEASSFGRFNYSVSGGSFLSHQNLQYLDYQHFTSSSSTLFERAESFEILNSYRYSASRYFVHVHAEENFMGGLFAKIPILRKLNLQELAGISYMKNDELLNYTELYAGLQKFGFRAGFTFGFLPGGKHINGFTLNIGGF